MKTIRKARLTPRAALLRTTMAGLAASALAAAFSPAAQALEPASDAKQQTPAAVAPPDVRTVMHTIYQVDGQGKDSYEVANGSVATYWYGHAFELNGTRYFTGFTWDTRERYGKPGEDDAGPDTQVNLAEATYTLTGSTPDKPWQFRGMTNTIGNFGAYEKPEFVDPKRKPVEYRTPAGQLVLALPTDGFDNGTSFTGYALFVFNPGPRDELKDKVWTYVGSVNTGSDNSAACADGDVMPCVSSQGELSFAAHGGSDMPRISVKVSGTTITGPGKTRQLGAADTVTYHYDAAGKKYASQ